MFKKANDPLVNSVKAVMKENEIRRQAEAALNEELGITSKKALPHEYHEAYDRALKEMVGKKKIEESLVGDQWKLDKNRNNELDRDDFKRVRKEGPNTRTEELNKAVGGNPITKPDPKAPKAIEEAKATPAQKREIAKVMRTWKKGEEHIGKSEETVPKTKAGRRQAVAIALSKAGLSNKSVKEEMAQFPEDNPFPKKVGVMPGGITNEPPSPKETSKFTGPAIKSAVKSTVKEGIDSIISEIRTSLQEQLAEAYLDSDPTVFENFVNSLTEEQIDILGLNEDWRSSAFGDTTSGGTLSNSGYRPSERRYGNEPTGAYTRTVRPSTPATSSTSRPSVTSPARPTPSPAPTAARPVTPGPSSAPTKPSTTQPSAPIELGAGRTPASKPQTNTSTKSGPAPLGAGRTPADYTFDRTPKSKQTPLPQPNLNVYDVGSGERIGTRNPGTGHIVGPDDKIIPNPNLPTKQPVTSPNKNYGAPDIPTNVDLGTGEAKGRVNPGTGELVSGTAPPEFKSQPIKNKPAEAGFSLSGPQQLSGPESTLDKATKIIGLRESSQIKESLESFLRNRFMKG